MCAPALKLVVLVIQKGVDVDTRLGPARLHIPLVLEHIPKAIIVIYALRKLEGESYDGDVTCPRHRRVDVRVFCVHVPVCDCTGHTTI